MYRLSFITTLFIISTQLLYADTQNSFPFIQPISVEFEKKTSQYFADKDKDGIQDSKDKCLNTLNNVKVDLFGCQILRDDDNDGVANKDDKCPQSKINASVNSTGCEPDSDKDGVIDLLDECPSTSKDFMVDKVGCPLTAVLDINFVSTEADVLPQSLKSIQEFASFLQKNESYHVIIYGHTDNVNSKKSNKKLSQNRADTVMNLLIKYGVRLTRLTAIGMGSKSSIADNGTPQGRAKNRRIEIELLQ